MTQSTETHMRDSGLFLITSVETSRRHVGPDELDEFVATFPQHAGLTLDGLRELLIEGISEGSEEAEWMHDVWLAHAHKWSRDTKITSLAPARMSTQVTVEVQP
ncbi:hypothetical protein [Gordonia alkanivorans]|uniref:hypothetical protein n=1 Tax=Gordonia alkanivorans TaxID=84096 RepID=UPI0012DE9DC3|nr:hypothetical protein [Gordonia alkanivorans]